MGAWENFQQVVSSATMAAAHATDIFWVSFLNFTTQICLFLLGFPKLYLSERSWIVNGQHVKPPQNPRFEVPATCLRKLIFVRSHYGALSHCFRFPNITQKTCCDAKIFRTRCYWQSSSISLMGTGYVNNAWCYPMTSLPASTIFRRYSIQSLLVSPVPLTGTGKPTWISLTTWTCRIWTHAFLKQPLKNTQQDFLELFH